MSAVVEARLPPAAELQRAGVDRGVAGIAAGAGEAQHPGAGLAQATRATDAAGEARGRGLVHGEAAVAQGDGAAGAGKRADGLAAAVLDIEAAGIDESAVVEARLAPLASCSVPASTMVSPV